MRCGARACHPVQAPILQCGQRRLFGKFARRWRLLGGRLGIRLSLYDRNGVSFDVRIQKSDLCAGLLLSVKTYSGVVARAGDQGLHCEAAGRVKAAGAAHQHKLELGEQVRFLLRRGSKFAGQTLS